MKPEIILVNSGVTEAGRELRSVSLVEVRNYDGKPLGILCARHDGTLEDMVRTALVIAAESEFYFYDRVSHINSFLFGVDQNGILYSISPNGRSVAEAGTSEAAYIRGDLTAAN